MGLNLINLLKDYITPEVISKASSFVGENESGTSKAIDSIVPSVLGGLLNKAQDENGLSIISNLITSGNHNGAVLNNVLNMFNGGEQTDNIIRGGASAITSIFGENKSVEIAAIVANQAGVQPSGASKLLNLVTPLVLGLLGKQTNGDTKGLASLLAGQKDFIAAAAPSGLAGLLGLGSLSALGGNLVNTVSDAVSSATSTVASTASTVTNATKDVVEDTTEAAGGLMKWLLPLLLIGAAIAAIFFGMKSCNKPTEEVVVNTDSISVSTTETTTAVVTGKFDSISGDWNYELGNIIPLKLKDGTEIQVGEFSTESKLVAFLNSSEALDTVKGNWFDFTNVKFKTGSSEITEESIAQLKNLVAIAKAYPTAQFKVGGYTDNTGDAAANVALSQKRADVVAAKIVALGAAKSSIVGAKGYGPEWPVADNSTAEGRAQNRRVSVNVKAR
jgi:outer membrane protein OmpA-like peptidoglycan-associated protein